MVRSLKLVMGDFTIGKLASEASVGVETVRFYERKGLIKKPSTRIGFRHYPKETIQRILFIKRAQNLGFTLKEVQELLFMNTDMRATCGDVQVRAESKIAEIQEKIKDLQRMKKSLQQIEAACAKSKEAVACCRIIDCFEGNC